MEITNINEGETITVHYGADGGGAEVPTEADDYSFVIQTKSTDNFQDRFYDSCAGLFASEGRRNR